MTQRPHRAQRAHGAHGAHGALRTAFRCSATTLLAAGLTVGGVAAASADTPDDSGGGSEPADLSIDGDLQPIEGLNVLNIQADGMRDSEGTTTGTYTATVEFGSSTTPLTVRGPITCIDVEGDDAALVYPISDIAGMTLPGSLENAAAVKISVHQGSGDEGDMVGVAGPMPTGAFDGCAPGDTPFGFDGTIEATAG